MTTCSATVWDGFHRHGCSRTGTIVEEGKAWCKTHAPSAVKARGEARERKWQDERRARAIRAAESRAFDNVAKEAIASFDCSPAGLPALLRTAIGSWLVARDQVAALLTTHSNDENILDCGEGVDR